MRNIFLFCLLLGVGLSACDSNPDKSVTGSIEEVDKSSGYDLTTIPGTSAQRAVLKNAEGKVLEEGVYVDGKKEGTWIFYNEEKAFPVKMISYVNGVYNGPYLEFNESGSITLATSYLDNKLHGDWKKYRFGRIESSAEYANGELDGLFVEYNFRDGKMKKEIYYKGGIQDGPMRFYDENENMTIEFIYKNGEKVSGGSE